MHGWPIKKIVLILTIFTLLIGLVVGVWLVQQKRIFQPKATTSTITVSFVPASLSLNINDQSWVALQISAGIIKVVGVDLELEYGNGLEPLDFIPEAGAFDTNIYNSPYQRSHAFFDRANKRVRYTAANKGTNNKDGVFTIGVFKFKATTATRFGTITFKKAQIITRGGGSGFSVDSSSVATYTIGQPGITPTPTPTPATAPTCTEAHPGAATTTATSGTFRVYATGVQNADSFFFPTWSEINSQDDLVWYPGTNDGGGAWYADIDLAKHPGPGWIRVHTYMNNSNYTNRFCDTADFQQLAPPSPTPAGYGCTASYELDPVSPPPNSTVTIKVSSSNSSNYQCVVLYQNNQVVPSCQITEGAGVGNYICTINSGNLGNHTLQLKFGQTNRYPAGTDCREEVVCNPATYQTSHP